ncbi:MAG: hypothetical protein ACOCQG_03235 [Candidatus Nanoarchaeia archaeon]
MDAFYLSLITTLIIFVGFWISGLAGIIFLATGSILLIFSYLKYKEEPGRKTKIIFYLALALLVAGIFMRIVEYFVL